MLKNLFRRRIFWLVIFLIAIAGSVYAYWQLNPPPKGPTLVTVQRGDLKATVNANGRVRSKQSVRLALPASGIVARVNVAEGDNVKANAVLVEFDNTETQRRLRQAEINVDSRQRDYDRLKTAPRQEDLDAAQQNIKRAAIALAAAEKNYKDNATNSNQATKEIAQIDYDNAKANFNRVAQGANADDLKNAQNNLEWAKLDLDSAKRALEQTRVVAPFDGVVIEVNARVGELVGGFTPLVTLADTTRLEIQAQIDEVDVANVAVGQHVDARFDAFSGKILTGTITRLYPAANTDRGSTVYFALIDFEKQDTAIRPGMGATLSITTIEKKNVLWVPARAVKNAGAQKFVTVMQDGQRHDTVVQVGVTTGSQTEIVSGVKEGDQVLGD